MGPESLKISYPVLFMCHFFRNNSRHSTITLCFETISCCVGNCIFSCVVSLFLKSATYDCLACTATMLHVKCRGLFYPRTLEKVRRFVVPDDKISWSVEWPEYKPINYTADYILEQTWADPNISSTEFTPAWNSVDGNVNRKSHMGSYDIVNSFPRNPIGRTGIVGRGCLGRWGPNHAADPIVTRWKRQINDGHIIERHSQTNQPILQFVAIQRKDSGEWAIPGGMVDPGEVVTATLRREFMEEALNILEKDESQKQESAKMINTFFDSGTEVYKGYVDDPRNTDNAWMETVAMNFHDESGTSVGAFPLCAGDDAANVRWMDISADLKLYASHINLIENVATMHKSHW